MKSSTQAQALGPVAGVPGYPRAYLLPVQTTAGVAPATGEVVADFASGQLLNPYSNPGFQPTSTGFLPIAPAGYPSVVQALATIAAQQAAATAAAAQPATPAPGAAT